MRISRRTSLLSLAVLMLIGSGAALPGEQAIPPDFKLVASTTGGLFFNKCSTIITHGGQVEQFVAKVGQPDEGRMFTLSRQQMADLVNVIRTAGVRTLRRRYSYPAFDMCNERLTITMDGQSYRVSVYASYFISNDPEVTRFLMIWSKVFELAPYPEPQENHPEKDDPWYEFLENVQDPIVPKPANARPRID